MDEKRRHAIAQLVADALVEKKRDQNHNHRVLICGTEVFSISKEFEADAHMKAIDFKNTISRAVDRVIRSMT